MQKIEEVAIIGAGPAGIATAIQLKRYEIEPIVFEKALIGGLLLNANIVENYPGFPEGISGIALVKLFEDQLNNSAIKVHNSEVAELDFKNDVFSIKTNIETLHSKIAVIASGTKPKLTELKIPKELGNKILYEIYPILNVHNKRIVIMGSGDAAFDYALNLAKYNEITILNRSSKRKCLPLLWQRVMHSPKITYFDNTEVIDIKACGDGIIIKNKSADEVIELHSDYLIFAIGREPQINYFSKRLRENASALENLNKLYFAGDVKGGIYRQTAIAVGEGIHAAMRIHQTLRENKKS